MEQNIRILIVDDYPMTISGYKMALKAHESHYSFEIAGAHNCDEVLAKMKTQKNNFFDIVLLDISIPASKDNVVLTGEDLGLLVRSNFPRTRIIVHTGLSDQQRVSDIFNNLNPEGFLIKSDIEPEILSDAVHSVLKNESYYSEKTNRLLNSSEFNNIHIDSIDRKILYYLSIGEKMKNLPKYIHLSMSTVERRKKNLKFLFDIDQEGDRKLLAIAKEKGYL